MTMLHALAGLMAKAPVPLALTYKGHGKTHGDVFDSVNNRTLNYGTVLGGSAPAAGDLVCWMVSLGAEYNDSDPTGRFIRLTVGSGWAQENRPAIPGSGSSNFQNVSVLSKVIDASDVSSPLAWASAGSATNDFTAAHGFWIAYSVVGVVSSVTIPSATLNNGGESAPSNVSVNSSALTPPDAAITMAAAFGTDGSVSLSGITLDFEETQNNWGEYYSANLDSRMGAKLDVGGAAYTLSKGDDGSANGLFGGYVAIS